MVVENKSTFGVFLSDSLLVFPLASLFFILLDAFFDFLKFWIFFQLQSTNNLRTRYIIAFACYECDGMRVIAEAKSACVPCYGPKGDLLSV
jgi:hypothetical protein